jgi:hypothetical protein
VNILFRADLLENRRPDSDSNFAEMRCAEKQHHGAGLADSAVDTERNFVSEWPGDDTGTSGSPTARTYAGIGKIDDFGAGHEDFRWGEPLRKQ